MTRFKKCEVDGCRNTLSSKPHMIRLTPTGIGGGTKRWKFKICDDCNEYITDAYPDSINAPNEREDHILKYILGDDWKGFEVKS